MRVGWFECAAAWRTCGKGASLQLRTAAATTRGGVKDVNQDSCCVLEAQSEFGPVALVVVCDGVGGLATGELASTYVVNRFAQWFEHALPSYLAYNSEGGRVDISKLEGVWGDLLEGANARIAAYGQAHGARMGTTFSGLLACQDSCFIGQVGDSRVYRLRGGHSKPSRRTRRGCSASSTRARSH